MRKQKAPGAGADHVLDPTSTDVAAEVAELKSAILSTRAGGTVVNVAIWGHEASVAMNDLVFHQVSDLGFDELIDNKEENVKILVRP